MNILFAALFTYTAVSAVIRLDRWLDQRNDARRRNQDHPWRR